jgi:hypothetical protein
VSLECSSFRNIYGSEIPPLTKVDFRFTVALMGKPKMRGRSTVACLRCCSLECG